MKKRFFAFGISFLFLFFTAWVSLGQQTVLPADPSKAFRQANLFFQSKNFIAAREEFIHYLAYLQQQPHESTAEKTQVEYYIAMCSIYTMRPEAEMQALRFASEHPESPYTAQLKKDIGGFYYETGDWVRAIRYLSQSAQTNLEHAYFMAISHYQLQHYPEALVIFNSLKNDSEIEFALPAAYYAGVMQYKQGNYVEAIDDFKIAAADPIYTAEAPQWICSALVKLGKYEELEQYAEPILADTSGKYQVTELAFILAEKQFQMANYAKSAKNFEILYKHAPALFTRRLNFKRAFAYVQSNQAAKALPVLLSIASPADSIGQEINQLTADIYFKQGKQDERLVLLDQIAALPYNTRLQENAFYSRWEILKVKKDWARITKDVTSYLQSDANPIHAEMLVDLALYSIQQTDDLKALSHFMLHAPVGKSKFQALYQFLMYQKGAAYYASNDQKQAITFLKRSLEYPLNQEMAWNARFAQAEMLAKNNKNSDAIKIYMPLLEETSKPTGSPELSQRIRLSLAQSFTYITMYDRAQNYFEDYLTNKLQVSKTVDDFRNAGETAIANGKINVGLAYFDQGIALGQTGTASLLERKAKVLMNERRFEEAHAVYEKLSQVSSNTAKHDEALYLANLARFRSQNKVVFAELIASLSGFILQSNPANPYLSSSLLLRGETYEVTNQWILALADYQRLVRDFTKDSTAKEALIGASEILKREGRSEEIFELRQVYAAVHGDEKGDDEELFDLCRSIFDAGKYRIAVPELAKFVSKYPKFAQMAEVNWMLGFGTFQTKDWANSITYLKRVVAQVEPSTNKSEALWLLASIELEQKHPELASAYLLDLIRDSQGNEAVKTKARPVFFDLCKQLDQLSKFEPVLEADFDVVQKSQLHFELAQVYASNQKIIDAQRHWVRVVALDSSDLGAQALIFMANSMSQSADFKGSTELIKQYFGQEGARYFDAADAWVGKAYLLMADNFISLKNGRQAKVILDSILSSITDESILLQAKKKLEELSK
jgi:tetratricopeptide (TPR) repeat protein